MAENSSKSTQPSFDPFTFLHSDVHELIFQHFDFSDFIKFSLTSPKYYERSAASPKCMRKVNVLSEFLITLKQEDTCSKRVYQSISLTNHNNINTAAFVRLTKTLSSNWKFVKVEEKKFLANEFQELMLHIEPTVEELIISNCEIKQLSSETFRLSKLKKLQIRNCAASSLFIFSNGQLNLTTLCLKLSNQLDEPKKCASHDLVKKIILNCDKLESLTLSNWKVSSIFTENVIKIMKMNIKKLKITLNDCVTECEALKCFLSSPKSGNLTSLTIKGKVRNLLLETIFNIPKLQMLKLSRLLLVLPINLKLNHSINELHLLDKSLPVVLQKRIIESSPNLTFLSIYAICNQNVDFIASNCKKLESLSIAYLWMTNLPAADCFSSLKKLQIAGDVQYLLEQEIVNKPENERTHFEELILSSI